MTAKLPILLFATAMLGACSTLPNSGPTGSEIRKTALADSTLGIALVEVDTAAMLPAPAPMADLTFSDLVPPPSDMVGPGDVLGISIYEAGVTLFSTGGAAPSSSAAPGGVDAGVRVQTLPEMRVNDDGDITIPYAGKLRVLGKTVTEIAAQIRTAMRGLSQDPQVLVTRREVISNAVIVGGEVSRPGRLVLQTNRESMSDVIALAGGYKGKASELLLRVTRAGTTSALRLSTLLDGQSTDIRAYPGDRLTLVSSPLFFSILGAAGRMEQVPFPTATVTLAQAISLAGGPNSATGDPGAIFVFRYNVDEQGVKRPFVYHINMMKAGSYFLAQNFHMRDGDVLYFGNAKANQPSKLIQLISQLFSPLLTITSAVSVIQN